MTSDKLTSILRIDRSSNLLLKEITDSINQYLKKNKGNAADFHLLKNIVDRHLDTIDEEVGHLLPVPLYLGLAGTMVGIITGLMSINGDVNSDAFVESITVVVWNIKWAMICSLLGLCLTTFLSAWAYRRTKAKMERQKNMFLDYLQSELLPHLNEDATATLLNMQANLKMFNDDFQDNIKGFNGIMNEVRTAFNSQVELVRQLKNMDLVKMSTLNINVLDKLNQSMREFEKFTKYLNGMNEFVSKTTALTNSVNSQLDRTDLVREAAQGIKDSIERNETVMTVLQEFLERVDENKALATASTQMNDAVVEAMKQMKNHVEEEVAHLKEYTERATKDLEDLMQRERGHLNKLNSLDSLKELSSAVTRMVNDTTTINQNLAKRIADLSSAIKSGPTGESRKSGLPSWLSYIVAILLCVTCCSVLYKVLLVDDKNSAQSVTTAHTEVSPINSVPIQDSITQIAPAGPIQ